MKRKLTALLMVIVLLAGILPAGMAEGVCPGSTDGQHNWQLEDTTDPWCTEPGMNYYYCPNCEGYKEEVGAPALGHDFQDDWTELEPATCTDAGMKVRYCHRCQARDIAEIPALGHNWEENNWYTTISPDCTNPGEQTNWCTRCQAETKREIPALGHAWDSGTVTTEPTCTTEGVRTYKCTNTFPSHICTETKTEAIPALGHDFQKYQDTKAATCTEPGERTWYCGRCDQTKTEATPALGHDAATAPGKAATCTEAGLSDGSTCSRCGTVIQAQQPIPALGHDYRLTASKEPTATEDGYRTYTCSRCGDSYTEIIPKVAHEHNYTLTAETAATCTEAGSKTYTCTVCGATYSDTVPATGHDWGEWVTVKEATETEDGQQERTCKNDPSHKEQQKIPAAGKKPSLDIVWEYDIIYDSSLDSLVNTTVPGVLDAEDAAFVSFNIINNGNIPLEVRNEGIFGNGASAKQYFSHNFWEGEILYPGDKDSANWGAYPLNEWITPGTETEDLLGTVTITVWATGYDLETGEQLCETKKITRTYEVGKPSGTPDPWEIPDESQLELSLAQGGGWNEQADPAGYQLGETWDTTITVRNTGPVDVEEYVLRVDYIAGKQTSILGDNSSWYELPGMLINLLLNFDDGLTAGKEFDFWGVSPAGEFTAEDVARGYVYARASVRWTDPESGKEKVAYSNPLYLTVISKTGLLVKKGIEHGPENGEYFQEGEAIPWTLTVTNNSNEPITNVTVTDQGTVVGTFAEIKPGETLPCTVPPHVVTEYEAKVVGTVSNIASAVGTDLKGETHTYPSNPCDVPTNKHSPTPLPPTGDKKDGEIKEDTLPPGTPETPEKTGTPGGGEDPLGPIHGVTAGATVYKTTAHGPKNYTYYELGEQIDYTITVKNIGEVAIENLKLYDSLGGLDPIDTWPSLAPNEEHTFSFQWTVNDGNISDGYVMNQATLTYTFLSVSGTPMKSNPVYVIAGKDGHLPGPEEILEKGGETTTGGSVPHFPGLTGGGAVTGPDGGTVTSEFGTPVLTAPDGTTYTFGPDGKPVKTDASGKAIKDADGGYIYLSFGDLDLCALETAGRSDSEIRYTLHTCSEHKAAAEQAKDLSAAEAAALWREEVNKLYETLYEAGDDEARAAVMDDRIAYWAYIDAWTAKFGDDAALASMLRLRCAELCCLIHTAPAELPGSITAGAAMEGTAGAICERIVDEENGEVILRFDAAHGTALADTLGLLAENPGYAADSVLKRAQTYWVTALDQIVNTIYKAADREAKKVIASWRQGLDTMVGARYSFLSLIYGDEEKVTNEAILNLYRDALIDTCSHK